MSSEAGPSNPAPLFKKRGKSNTTSRISQAVIDDQPTPSSTNDPDSTLATSSSLASSAISATSKDEHAQHEEEHEISVQDLIALRSLTRKPTGIELERLNKGERQKKKKNKQKEKSAAQQEEERWEQQMKNGGLMANGASRRGADGGEEEDSEEELDPDKPRRLVRKNNFQGETGTVDVDKHMMNYIEEEMRKRTGTSSSSSSLDASALQAAIKNLNPEDELYTVAEKYKQLAQSIKPEQTQEEREGNVALSSAMLSSIPEVDLGIDTRMKNIEQTERAKRQFYENKANNPTHTAAEDLAFANTRFQSAKPRFNSSDAFHRSSGSTGARSERKQMATDQLVLDRFKKRQRNFK